MGCHSRSCHLIVLYPTGARIGAAPLLVGSGGVSGCRSLTCDEGVPISALFRPVVPQCRLGPRRRSASRACRPGKVIVGMDMILVVIWTRPGGVDVQLGPCDLVRGASAAISLHTGPSCTRAAPLAQKFDQKPLFSVSTSSANVLSVSGHGVAGHGLSCWLHCCQVLERRGQVSSARAWSACSATSVASVAAEQPDPSAVTAWR